MVKKVTGISKIIKQGTSRVIIVSAKTREEDIGKKVNWTLKYDAVSDAEFTAFKGDQEVEVKRHTREKIRERMFAIAMDSAGHTISKEVEGEEDKLFKYKLFKEYCDVYDKIKDFYAGVEQEHRCLQHDK